MADEETITIQTTRGWAVSPQDNGNTAIIFRLHRGPPVGFSLSPDSMNRFTEGLLAEAGKLAAKKTPELPPETLQANPIPSSAIGISPHPQDASSALVSLQTGNLVLTYAVDLTMLRDQCELFLQNTTRTGPIPTQ